MAKKETSTTAKKKAVTQKKKPTTEKKYKETAKPFLIGNKFWEKRTKHGRNRIFEDGDILWEECCGYFIDVLSNPILIHTMSPFGPTFIQKKRPFSYEGLCNYLGVNTKYFWEAERIIEGKTDEISVGLSETYARVRQTIYQQKYEGALVGEFNSNLIAKDFGMHEYYKHEITADVKSDVTVTQQSKVEITLPDNQRGNPNETKE